jgi:hypothetical protein
MARSGAAEVQEESPDAQSKKKKPELLRQLNQIIDLAVNKGRAFSVNDLREFEQTGKAAREEHDMSRMLPTPTAREKSGVAKVVPSREMEMNRPAVLAALKLAETLELAGSARTLSMKAWVDGGRMS